jgi:hypothetical protein
VSFLLHGVLGAIVFTGLALHEEMVFETTKNLRRGP